MVSQLELELSLEEKEILCSLNFANTHDDNLTSYQRALAKDLSELFEHGGEDASQDEHKAEKYRTVAHLPPKPSKKTTWTTANIYGKFGWFTTLRLTLFRLNRFVDQCSPGSAFIPEHLNLGFVRIPSTVGCFSYGAELLVDGAMIAKSIFSPGAHESKSVPKRLKNILTKDTRPYRMTNALIWLGINIATFGATGGMSAIVNIIGFALDLVHESIRTIIELKTNQDFLNKVDKRLATIKEELELHPNPKNIQAINLKKEQTSLLTIKDKLHERQKNILETRAFVVFATTLVLIGMKLILFPISPISAAIGAGLVLLGSLLFLTRRIKNAYFPSMPKPTPPPPQRPSNIQDPRQSPPVRIKNGHVQPVTPRSASFDQFPHRTFRRIPSSSSLDSFERTSSVATLGLMGKRKHHSAKSKRAIPVMQHAGKGFSLT